MNFKTTMLLVFLVVIVGVLWLFFPSGNEAAESELEETLPRTGLESIFEPEPDRDAITRIIIERPDAPRIVFEREPRADAAAAARPGLDRWRMVAPVVAAAEPSQVNMLLRSLMNVQSRTELKDLSPDDAGLNPPTATFTFVGEDEEYVIEVGGKAVMSNDTYVRVGGEDAIHVANRDLRSMARKDVDELRAKRLVDVRADQATALDIRYQGRSYNLTRAAGGDWVINQPVRAHADREAVQRLIRKLSGLRVKEFIDDAPETLSRFGLAEPYLSVRVTTEEQRPVPSKDTDAETQPSAPEMEIITETHGVVFGSPAGLKQEDRYLKPADADWVAIAADTDIEPLVPDLNALRDPQITRIQAADVTSLELTSDGQTAALQRVDGRWQGSDELTDVEPAAVQDVLQALEDLTAVSYIDEPGALEDYGLAAPRAVVTVSATGAVDPRTLRVGGVTESGRNAYVQRDGEPTVIVTSAAQAERLVIDPLALRSREIFAYEADRLLEIEVNRDGRQYVLTRADGAWKLTTPTEAPVALSTARNLANDLARLRAAQVVARAADGQYGFSDPVATIRFTVAPLPPAGTQPTVAEPAEPIEHTVTVGRVDNVAYVRTESDPYVFEIDETVYDVLTAELIDPDLLTFKTDLVNRIVVSGGDETVELVREDSVWKYAPEPYLELSQDAVQELLDRLAGLEVERYLVYQDADLAAHGLDNPAAALRMELGDGRRFELRLGAERPEALTRIAGLVDAARVFTLSDEDCAFLLRGLDAYLAETP